MAVEGSAVTLLLQGIAIVRLVVAEDSLLWSSRRNGGAGYIGAVTLGSTDDLGREGKHARWKAVKQAARPQGRYPAGLVTSFVIASNRRDNQRSIRSRHPSVVWLGLQKGHGHALGWIAQGWERKDRIGCRRDDLTRQDQTPNILLSQSKRRSSSVSRLNPK
jgi:hypothetical protein